MTYRPFPNPTRARHQLDRHDDETGPYREPRPMTPMEEAVGYARAAVQLAAPAMTVAAMAQAFQHPASARLGLLPAPWDHGRGLPCDGRCVCPIHRTPLIYWPAGDDHACQDVDCRYGRGMRDAPLERPVGGEETNR